MGADARGEEMAAARAAAGGCARRWCRGQTQAVRCRTRPLRRRRVLAAPRGAAADGEASRPTNCARSSTGKALTRGLLTSPDGGQLRASIEVVAQARGRVRRARGADGGAVQRPRRRRAAPGRHQWTHVTAPRAPRLPCSLCSSTLCSPTPATTTRSRWCSRSNTSTPSSRAASAPTTTRRSGRAAASTSRRQREADVAAPSVGALAWRARSSVSERLARRRSALLPAAARAQRLTTACTHSQATTRTPSSSRCRSGRRADCASCYTIEIVHPRGTPPVPALNEAGIAAYLDGLYCHDAEAPCWAMGDGAERHPERARQRFASVMAIALVACMLFIVPRLRRARPRAKRKKEEDMV